MKDQRDEPKEAIKEELGGDYYYRCPWLVCDHIIRSEWNYCPFCGQRIIFGRNDYALDE